MGLFSKFARKEASPQAETPVEQKAEKSTADTGRERVTKISSAMKETWSALKSKGINAGKWLSEKAASLGYGLVGGVEKGIKATGAKMEAGRQFAKETVGEARQLKSELKAGLGEGIDLLYKEIQNKIEAGKQVADNFAQELGEGMESGVRELFSDIQTSVEAGKTTAKESFTGGVDVLDRFAQDKVNRYNKFIDNAKAAPADAKTIWEGVKAQVIGAITEQLGQAQHRGRIEYTNAHLEVGKSKDGFLGWANKKRTELAGTAELRGEVGALKEQIDRQSRIIEQLVALQNVGAEEGSLSEAGA